MNTSTRTIRLALLGDVMLGRGVNAVLREREPDHPWGDTLPLLGRADLRLCNLECVISDHGRPWSRPAKAFHFRSDAAHLEVLARARIDAVALANNHVLDYEHDALVDMLDRLDAAGIGRAGAGRDAAEAARPAVLEAAGWRVGLLAFTDTEPGWEAAEGRPGVCYVPADPAAPSARALLDRVAAASGGVDALVVSAHWGPNWGVEAPPEHVELARALVDAGARVVFGHSPHTFRAVEPRGNGLILYSAGDFIDDYAVDELERNDWSAVFEVELDARGVRSARMAPTVIRGCAARLALGAEREAIARKLGRLCAARGVHTEWLAGEGCLVWRAAA